jgi:hypothetical protein
VVGAAFAQPRPGAVRRVARANVKAERRQLPGFEDNAAFRQYVDAPGKPAALVARPKRLAYYINAYNALAIEGILDGCPVVAAGPRPLFQVRNGR